MRFASEYDSQYTDLSYLTWRWLSYWQRAFIKKHHKTVLLFCFCICNVGRCDSARNLHHVSSCPYIHNLGQRRRTRSCFQENEIFPHHNDPRLHSGRLGIRRAEALGVQKDCSSSLSWVCGYADMWLCDATHDPMETSYMFQRISDS